MESSGGTREPGLKLPSLISSVMRNGNPLNQCPPGLVLPLSCEFGVGFCKNLLSEVLRCGQELCPCGCVGVLILPQLWEGCHHSRGDLSIVTTAEMSPKFTLRLWWQHCFLNSCRNLADPWSCFAQWFCSILGNFFHYLEGDHRGILHQELAGKKGMCSNCQKGDLGLMCGRNSWLWGWFSYKVLPHTKQCVKLGINSLKFFIIFCIQTPNLSVWRSLSSYNLIFF